MREICSVQCVSSVCHLVLVSHRCADESVFTEGCEWDVSPVAMHLKGTSAGGT